MAGNRFNVAYWIGVFMVIVCIAAVFAEYTYLPRKIELGDISLVWLAGGAALLSFLVYELMDSVAGTPPDMKPRQPEIHAAESPVREAPDNQRAVSASEPRDRVTTGTGR
jgi:hypothetical protein